MELLHAYYTTATDYVATAMNIPSGRCGVKLYSPQPRVITLPPLNPRPRKEMRLHQEPRQIRVPDRLAHTRVEARRRPEDDVVVLEHDPGDEARAGLVADSSPFQ